MEKVVNVDKNVEKLSEMEKSFDWNVNVINLLNNLIIVNIININIVFIEYCINFVVIVGRNGFFCNCGNSGLSSPVKLGYQYGRKYLSLSSFFYSFLISSFLISC